MINNENKTLGVTQGHVEKWNEKYLLELKL